MVNRNRIELIIFDLDGVLINKDIHFQALNLALAEYTDIQLKYFEHEKYYDGRPTKIKLKLLEENKGLDPKISDKIWAAKQEQTKKLIQNLQPDDNIKALIQLLISDDYILSLASNAIRSTVETAINNLQINDFIYPLISNEDVRSPKPFPECYWKCMEFHKILPQNTLIIEDSPVGIDGARNSGAHVYECITSKYLDYQKIVDYIQYIYRNPRIYY